MNASGGPIGRTCSKTSTAPMPHYLGYFAAADATVKEPDRSNRPQRLRRPLVRSFTLDPDIEYQPPATTSQQKDPTQRSLKPTQQRSVIHQPISTQCRTKSPPCVDVGAPAQCCSPRIGVRRVVTIMGSWSPTARSLKRHRQQPVRRSASSVRRLGASRRRRSTSSSVVQKRSSRSWPSDQECSRISRGSSVWLAS